MFGATILIGLVCGATAMPLAPSTTELVKTLFTTDASHEGTFIWLSKVSPTIYGDDASAYDYYLHSDPTAAMQAVQAYASDVLSNSPESATLTSFINATQAGTMTPDQANNITWKCLELSPTIRSAVSYCQGATTTKIRDESQSVGEESIKRRSLYRWLHSTAHKSSKYAMMTLVGVLSNRVDRSLPESPRSFCNTADGTNACFSWSQVEQSFSEGYARGFVQDGLNAVDLNSYSAQANGVVKKRQAAADACLSNRAKGCT